MVHEHSYNGSRWIELVTPTKEELKSVLSDYNIDPVVAHELTSPSPKSHIHIGDEYIYMVLHFPVFKHSHSNHEDHLQEVDFLITKDYLLTATYDAVDSLHKFSKELEVGSILKRGIEQGNHHDLFFAMFSVIYGSLVDEVYYIEDRLSEVEKKIFSDQEKEMVFELSTVGRQVLDFKKTLALHKPILETFRDEAGDMLGDAIIHDARQVLSEYFRIRQMVQSSFEAVHELRETNNSLLTTKQNEIVQILTVTTFIVAPLGLVAGIFGMNSTNLPFIGSPYDFLIILGIMLVATLGMYAFFKYKKWL